MVRKKIMKEVTRDCCDFCDNNEETVSMHKCDICGKDVCEFCSEDHLKITQYDYLYLCPNCINIDLTEYKNVAYKIAEQYAILDILNDEQNIILESIRNKYKDVKEE